MMSASASKGVRCAMTFVSFAALVPVGVVVGVLFYLLMRRWL
jgi:hypothetical protein